MAGGDAHPQECSWSFSPRLCKLENNTTSDWLNIWFSQSELVLLSKNCKLGDRTVVCDTVMLPKMPFFFLKNMTLILDFEHVRYVTIDP